MISDKLRLTGDSVVSMCIQHGDIDESEAYFKALSTKIVDKFYPELTGHLTRIDAVGQAHKCKTIVELESLRFAIIPDDLATKVAAELDTLEELSDTERLFTFFRVMDILTGGSFNHVQEILHQRASAIARAPKSKIITSL